MKRWLGSENLVMGFGGGLVCLAIGVFFAWADRFVIDEAVSKLVIASVFAGLFVVSGVVGEWYERRRRRGSARGFEVKRDEAGDEARRREGP